MVFQSEYRLGFTSTYTFKCKVCGIISSISSENLNSCQYMPLNKAIVSGSLAIGT